MMCRCQCNESLELIVLHTGASGEGEDGGEDGGEGVQAGHQSGGLQAILQGAGHGGAERPAVWPALPHFVGHGAPHEGSTPTGSVVKQAPDMVNSSDTSH